MQKIHHVFISSTYSDLQEERKKVSEALAKAGYVPEGMELFPASSQKQLEFIKRVIDRCDYYVVIIGGRYGSLADGNVSYTEQEYDYALSKGIPALAFLHRNPEKLESGKVDKDAHLVEALAQFRERLSGSSMVDFWEDASGLATAVVVAVGQEATLNPGVGWVRGDNAMDPKILEELAHSKQRVIDLEKERAAASAEQVAFPGYLEDISTVVEFQVEEQIQTRVDGSHVPKVDKRQNSVSTTWQEAFISIGDELFQGQTERQLVNAIATKAFMREAKAIQANQRRTVTFLGEPGLFRYQFEALGLIQAEMVVTSVRRGMEWHLTTKGRQYLTRELARAKKP